MLGAPRSQTNRNGWNSMCRICAEWQMGKLTNSEAWRNLGEVNTNNLSEEDLDHMDEVLEMIQDEGQRTESMEDFK